VSEQSLISVKDLLRRVGTRSFDYAAGIRKIAEAKVGPLTCRSGCAWCCTAKIIVDAGTGAIIALALKQAGRWTPALRARLAAVDREMSRTSHASWMALRRPCVFLHAEGPGRGTCTVYRYRPASCLATFSNTDPAACSVVGGVGAQFQISDDNLTGNLLVDHEALLNGAGETKMWLMTLPGAVLYGYAMLAGEPRPDVFRAAKEDWPRPDAASASATAMDLVQWLDQQAGAV
jgi:hypothetical protein